jgi:hypothetical protein
MSVRSDDGVEAEPAIQRRREVPRRVRTGGASLLATGTVSLRRTRPDLVGAALLRRRRPCAPRRRATPAAAALRPGAPHGAGEALQRAGAHAGAEDVAWPRADEGHGQDPVHAGARPSLPAALPTRLPADATAS